MVTSVCKCYKCGCRFNYEFIPGASFHSIRLGKKRIFRCPKCKTLQKFDLKTKGPDKKLKTYGDSAELGVGSRIFAVMLAPTLILVVFGVISTFLFNGASLIYISFMFIAAGVAWVFVYLVYLIKSVGPRRV